MLVAALGESPSASAAPATASTAVSASTRPGRRPEAATIRCSAPIRSLLRLDVRVLRRLAAGRVRTLRGARRRRRLGVGGLGEHELVQVVEELLRDERLQGLVELPG